MNKVWRSLLAIFFTYGLVNAQVVLGEPDLFPKSAIDKAANHNRAFSKPTEDDKPFKSNTIKKVEDKVKNIPIGGGFSDGKKTIHIKGKF